MAEVEREIRVFLADEVLEKRDGTLSAERHLLEGLLDSFELMTLIGYLEERFGVRIENDEVTRTNFESAGSLATLIERKLASRVRSSGTDRS